MITIEGLGTGLIGAYGSSTAVTPAIDSLAARGILLDQCFVDSQSLLEQLVSLWTAEHALGHKPHGWNIWRGVEAYQTETWQARLLTDSEQVAQLADEYACPWVTLLDPPIPTTPAHESSHCSLMALFAAAAEELEHGPAGLLWIHSRGLRLAWDAPVSMRRQFADPEDPPPPDDIWPPNMQVDTQTDPDWLVGWGQVAAAQSAVLDEALSGLLQTAAQRADAQRWSWILSGLGGIPLGEHGRCGWGPPQLYGEELHAATIMVPAPALPVGLRRPELFQLPDVGASLAALLALEILPTPWGRSVLQYGAVDAPERWPAELSLAMIADEQHTWIRTPAWSALLDSERALHATSSRSTEKMLSEQLFVKPDDRWEISQIADRRRDIVARHYQLAELFRRAIAVADRSQLPPLEEDLHNLLR